MRHTLEDGKLPIVQRQDSLEALEFANCRVDVELEGGQPVDLELALSADELQSGICPPGAAMAGTFTVTPYVYAQLGLPDGFSKDPQPFSRVHTLVTLPAKHSKLSQMSHNPARRVDHSAC